LKRFLIAPQLDERKAVVVNEAVPDEAVLHVDVGIRQHGSEVAGKAASLDIPHPELARRCHADREAHAPPRRAPPRRTEARQAGREAQPRSGPKGFDIMAIV